MLRGVTRGFGSVGISRLVVLFGSGRRVMVTSTVHCAGRHLIDDHKFFSLLPPKFEGDNKISSACNFFSLFHSFIDIKKNYGSSIPLT